VAILARATTRTHELQLREIGVDFVLRDTLHSSLRLARELLAHLGLSAAEAQEVVEGFAAHDAHTLERQAAVFRDEDAFRRTTISASEELKALFARDAEAEDRERGDGSP
jgi:voltage-gated potassium channel Kch